MWQVAPSAGLVMFLGGKSREYLNRGTGYAPRVIGSLTLFQVLVDLESSPVVGAAIEDLEIFVDGVKKRRRTAASIAVQIPTTNEYRSNPDMLRR